jgi:hypothetical protein
MARQYTVLGREPPPRGTIRESEWSGGTIIQAAFASPAFFAVFSARLMAG